MILAAAVYEHHTLAFLMMLFASAGVMEHSGIKVPHFTFFAHDSGRRVKEAPVNMLVAMGIAGFLCIYLAWPFGGYQQLYALMPFEMGKPYKPYTVDHVVFQMQLLFAAIFAFTLLKRFKLYPAERRAEILDADWSYRRLGFGIIKWGHIMCSRLTAIIDRQKDKFLSNAGRRLYQVFSPCLLYTSPSPRDLSTSRMPSSA